MATKTFRPEWGGETVEVVGEDSDGVSWHRPGDPEDWTAWSPHNYFLPGDGLPVEEQPEQLSLFDETGAPIPFALGDPPL